MGIEARTIDDDGRWDDLVALAEQPIGFHLAGALDVLAEHADAECHRLVGYKGEEPIGLFPVFTVSKGPFTGAFSPPPELKIPYLGPTLVNRQTLKRRRRDQRHRRFVDACLDWLDDRIDPSFTQFRTTPGYDDIRPFVWRGFEGTPRYTYVVDLRRDPEELLNAFSSDARGNVSGDYDVDYVIEEGGRGDAERIVEQVRERHAEQDESFPVAAPFVTDLLDALPESVLRPYVCRVDGDHAGGNLILEFADTSVCWLGSVNGNADIPVNDLLDWRYVRDAMDRGIEAYDLAGANNPRIAQYKAKFAPDLVPYFKLQAGSKPVSRLAKLYGSIT